MRCLADTAGLLRQDERGRVEVAMRRFSRRFPQLFIAIHTGTLDEVAELREFGFWLLNRAIFVDKPVETHNAAGILITIDPEFKVAGMTFGYLLDPFFEETDTFDCLSRAHSHWLEGRYADGMIKALDQTFQVLRKRCRRAWHHPDRFKHKGMPPSQAGDWVGGARQGPQRTSEARQVQAEEMS